MKRYFAIVLGLLAPAIGRAQTLPNHDYLQPPFFASRACANCHVGAVGDKDKKSDAKPGSLDQLIAEALKNNPDIRVAEAKLKLRPVELRSRRSF